MWNKDAVINRCAFYNGGDVIMKKVCFVVMGFGKKMDYRNSKEIDLDIIYNEVIKPLFTQEFQDYKLIRADEITGSDIIDVSMYTLLLKADLVIADITAANENAIYELGVRHALKPFSTIIMLQKFKNTPIPFDLSHNRILLYDDYGEELDVQEAYKIKKSLKEFVIASKNNKTDSPFYTYLENKVQPPVIEDDTEYKKLIEDIGKNEETVSNYLEKAKEFNKKSNFEEAIKFWNKLHKMLPNNEYIVQQLAFSTYKAKIPNETMALQDALSVINTLHPNNSLDLETLGLTGAIYKRLYMLNNNYDYLEEAIKMYQKGYIIKNDYYNGENYANCLLLKTKKPGLLSEEVAYLKYNSKKIYAELIDLLLPKIAEGEINYWMYATLATSYFCLEDKNNHIKYENLFFNNLSSDWEKETYNSNLDIIKQCL